ncbi:pickpocket protein 11-like [Onthophagus taurus]|uniref:pickpocket protein 11-like n=1 Tax=Onthophagus taurus TaxID=166361 RepID=UPI0039BE7D60
MAKEGVEMLSKLKYCAQNTSLHGIRYIVDDKINPVIRFIWLIIMGLSIYGMLIILKGSYESYKNDSISFVTETAYLDWNTTFPAVTICEINSADITWTNDNDTQEYSPVQQFLADLVFFTGSCYSCSADCEECRRLNFKEMVKRFRKPCKKLIKNCLWRGQKFDCCEKFLPLNTEYGVCFSLNSMHTKKTFQSHLDMESNRKTGPGELIIEPIDDIRFYFHAREDVPFINSDPDQRRDVMLGESYNVIFKVTEIENDENVIHVPVKIRNCRFPSENPPNLIVHNFYSYSTCIVQCHADAHLDLCNCTHHLMPVLGDYKMCDVDGLKCLTDKFDIVNRLHAKGFDKPGLVCECVPSCTEPEYKVIFDSKSIGNVPSKIILKMGSLPTSRFKRNVVRTAMDLVVSIGGNAGLFIGASLLSVIELIYLLFLRR